MMKVSVMMTGNIKTCANHLHLVAVKSSAAAYQNSD